MVLSFSCMVNSDCENCAFHEYSVGREVLYLMNDTRTYQFPSRRWTLWTLLWALKLACPTLSLTLKLLLSSYALRFSAQPHVRILYAIKENGHYVSIKPNHFHRVVTVNQQYEFPLR